MTLRIPVADSASVVTTLMNPYLHEILIYVYRRWPAMIVGY
jgi:hypothetical protein